MDNDELKDIIDTVMLWKKDKPDKRTVVLIAQDLDEDKDVSYLFAGNAKTVQNLMTHVFLEAPELEDLVMDAILAADTSLKTKGRPAN